MKCPTLHSDKHPLGTLGFIIVLKPAGKLFRGIAFLNQTFVFNATNHTNVSSGGGCLTGWHWSSAACATVNFGAPGSVDVFETFGFAFYAYFER